MKDRKAVELAERMSNIASQNTIVQFTSKLEAGLEGLRAELRAQDASIKAQNSKYNVLIWMIGFATSVTSASILISNNGG